jgi:hypothetical protein
MSSATIQESLMKRLAAVLCVALTCSACLRSTTTITVKPDGSGLIDHEMGANPQTLAMLKGFAGAQSDQKGANVSPEFFGSEQAKKMGEEMGVRFISGEPVKTAELEGYRAHYAFDDITKLKVKMNQESSAMPGATPDTEKQPPFAFDFTKGASSSVLTIRMPEPKAGKSPLSQLTQMPGAPPGGAQDNPQALAMMKVMLKGLFVDVSLAVDGHLVKTNAPYVSGSKITLMQMDFDKMLENEAALLKLQQTTDPKMLKDIPGLKIVTDPKLTIEFGK